jgi:hypothetical protein
MRNIDSALAQKSDEISILTARVDRMKLKAPRRKASTNGVAPVALPASENEKIKLASATALNMERSSIRLKNALLQARSETPLNTTAVGAPVEAKSAAFAKGPPARPPIPATPASSALPLVPPATSTPTPSLPAFGQRTTPNQLAPASKLPMTPGGFVFPPVTPAALPDFAPLGKDDFHVTSGYEHSGRRAEKSRMHGPSAKLKTPSPNISRTASADVSTPPLPAPTLTPSITPAKSFFGVGPTPSPVTERKTTPLPEGFFSFSSPSGVAAASTPPPPPKGFSFFQPPVQKAATTPTTPPIPALPKWALPTSANATKPNGTVDANKVKPEEETDEDGDGGSEGQSGDESENDEDEDDEEWVPEEDDEDEDEDDEDDISDGVPEGDGQEDEDPTTRI